MTSQHRILIVSDVHYASDLEKERVGYEYQVVGSPLLRLGLRFYRHFIWKRDPFAHNHRLDQFLEASDSADLVVANGDYSCDSAFVGVSDPAACLSARQCLEKLRRAHPERFEGVLGDHELGKTSLFGGVGGMRLRSWEVALNDLELKPAWVLRFDKTVLVGVVSTLIALPVFDHDQLPDERDQWMRLRRDHLKELTGLLEGLGSEDRILLFCHDPSALPFLLEHEAMRKRIPQIERTVIGHLHSDLILWQSKVLAGIPPIRFLGSSVHRMSAALNQARCWKQFKVLLCPAVSGIELLNDGGFYVAEVDPSGRTPVRFAFQALRSRDQ